MFLFYKQVVKDWEHFQKCLFTFIYSIFCNYCSIDETTRWRNISKASQHFIKKCSSKVLIIEILNYSLLHWFPLACSAVYVGGFSVFVNSLSLSLCVCVCDLSFCVSTRECVMISHYDIPLFLSGHSLLCHVASPAECRHVTIATPSSPPAAQQPHTCVCGCVNVSDVMYEHFSLDHTPFSLQELQCIISKFLHVRQCPLFHDVILLVKILWERSNKNTPPSVGQEQRGKLIQKWTW